MCDDEDDEMPDWVPSTSSVLWHEMRATFWIYLAYEHDGLMGSVERAKKECIEAAANLRAYWDDRGNPSKAEQVIAHAVATAREDLARDLDTERRDRDKKLHDWRYKRVQKRNYF